MSIHVPVRLGPAENSLIEQLKSLGANAQAERIIVAGLPTRKVESYHYTDLKQLLRAVPPLAKVADAIGAPAFDVAGAYRIVIANGAVQGAGTAPAGVIVGTAEGAPLTTRDDVLVKLNEALVKTTLSLTLESSVDPVIHIDRRTEGEAGHSGSGAKIFLADGASATVLETYSGSDAAHVANHATYVALGKGAELIHITLDLSSDKASHFASNEYHLAEGAQLRTLVIHRGAGLSRTNLFPFMEGANAHADLTGLNLVANGQHADITMETVHGVPHTTSKPLFKSITRGRSKAVVQGKLVVARDAQKTDAKLMSQGLMLSDEAEILSKPELEIYADDVVCGHGSTCGKLDEDSMFYLMSRGVPKAEAETMLVRGFIAELLDPVTDEALNEALQGIVDDWLLHAR